MAKLNDLKPTETATVYDLLTQVGIDVSDWRNMKRPDQYKSNPKYCSNWSFVEPENVVVLCIWYDDLRLSGEKIYQNLNMKELASQLSAVKKGNPQIRRANEFQSALKIASERNLPIRAIILGGTTQDIAKKGAKPSSVDFRRLDPVIWHVESLDTKSGAATIVRGEKRKFVDQYSVELPEDRLPKKKQLSGEAYERSQKVRGEALSRANGYCEYCGEPGFETHKGDFYLETHHIQPLSEDGLDELENVAALCVVHHRQAHVGKNRIEIRAALEKKFSRNRPL